MFYKQNINIKFLIFANNFFSLGYWNKSVKKGNKRIYMLA